MDFNIIWFVLIGILYTGFFILEGFDFGVGMLLPFIAKNDTERRVVINTIGPHWDGNEVWLLTAGGATFAAFPEWYATMFSGFYLALFLVLVALIVRGVAFEFRSKHDAPAWRTGWDWMIFVGSLLPGLLFGVAFANLIQGLPIENFQYSEGLFGLLSPYTLVIGLTAVAVFLVQGATYLSRKTTGELEKRAKALAGKLWVAAFVLVVISAIYSTIATDIIDQRGFLGWALIAFVVAAFGLVGLFLKQGKNGFAFIFNSLGILGTMLAFYAAMFPRVMVSTIAGGNLDIYNAASGDYTLKIMSMIALVLVPIILGYTAWAYWVFRKRVSSDPAHLEY